MASNIVDLTGTASPGQPTSLTARAPPRWDDSGFGTSKVRKRKAALLDDVETRLFLDPKDFRRCWASFMADLPSADVCELLLDILQKSPSARDIALKEYSRLKAKKQRIKEEKKWKNCKRCNQLYNTTETDTQCKEPYHPGEMEPDYQSDFWADWDEGCHGYIHEQADEYPGGFTYDCCGEPGDSTGCETGPHET